MKSREDAEDIAQAAYLRLYTLDDLNQLSNAKAFLFQVAANMSIDQLRREVLHKNYLDKEISKVSKDLSAMTPEVISLEREIEAKEALYLIHSRLEDLPQNAREAFILSRNKGWTYNQIATQLGVSVSSVEKYILLALKELREAVADIES
jgi:RNA polymerase sigma-70 factor (ECF subfamily)